MYVLDEAWSVKLEHLKEIKNKKNAEEILHNKSLIFIGD